MVTTRPSEDTSALHARLIKVASLDRALYNRLVSLYPPAAALRLFRRLPFPPSAVSWTALISAHSADPPAAFRLLETMLRDPTSSRPSQATVSALLKSLSSSSLRLFSGGLQIHALALKIALVRLPFAGSALVHFYCKAARPADALHALDDIPNRDEVCYAAAVVGLAQNRRPNDALSVFSSMHLDGVSSTMYSISGALRAASQLAALEQSQVIHAHAIAIGLDCNVIVGTALVDSYGKAGIASDARMVFEALAGDANLVAWNAMLSVYAQQGDYKEAFDIFDEMVRKDMRPDEYSFLGVLTACSNAGLVDEAKSWIELMTSRFRVTPGVEHYTCLIGAMARTGRLGDAEHTALTMPFEPDAAVWRTLLSGCVVHHAVEMAVTVGQRLLEINPNDDSAYVMLANVYSSAGKMKDRAGMWTEMRDRGVKKEGGRSWIEVRGEVHAFISGDRKHEKTVEIYAKLMELTKEAKELGYKETDTGLWCHSERLALAFGMMSGSVPEGKTMRIVKNLRICADCHEFFKCVNRVIKREIVVRDANRYHRFEDGCCNCKDNW